ncbi:GRP family sugar transporter [Granulicella arctica]|uniref:Glucose uptake protein n=1 Tax=Granulicella arctica TaxID=940613 RepID=A0A7Y9PIZ1_9BACT|nr:GRP family sugar transporter [Granulicella arctica]NYF80767.1 glucose uptake protein [Granulicella arctica]
MYQPEQYVVVLGFMIVSMVCWGSWANTLKLCPRFAFQLFYWDYTIGLMVGALFWGFTLGSSGASGLSFVEDLKQVQMSSILWAAAGGAVFNLANLLLVAAIDIAGMAVAFPIGIGLALVIGSVGGYVIAPVGNPYLAFGGVALVVAAIVCDALAYKARGTERSALQTRGIVISLVAGALMGTFYPLVTRSMTGRGHLPGPYAITFLFICGAFLSNIPVNFFFMKKPTGGGGALQMREYFAAKPAWHLYGVLGGVVWATGATASFVSSRAHSVGSAVSYSLGQGATMISAIWGIFVWKEFVGASTTARRYLVAMFVLFLLGLTALAASPTF